MGLFSRRKKIAAEERSAPFVPAAYGFSEWMTAALTAGGGTSVSPSEAMRNAAYFTCRDILCSSISQTPLEGLRGTTEMSALPPLVAQPDSYLTTSEWLYQVVGSLLDDGSAFGDIVDHVAGRPTQIETFDPADVTDRRKVDGVWTVRIANKDRALWPIGDVWHCPGRVLRAGSIFGMSIRDQAAGSINAGNAVEQYGRQFFEGGGHPTGIISSDDPDLDQDEADEIKKKFRRATANTREPLVWGSGLTWSDIQSNPGDSKVTELLNAEIAQVCRFARVPPGMAYLAMSGQAITYANVTQEDLAYLKHSVDLYFYRLETRISMLLPRPQSVRFDRGAFLRTDPLTSAQIDREHLATRTTTVNAVKKARGEAPFDDPAFDEPGVPGIVLMGKADPLIDPAGTDIAEPATTAPSVSIPAPKGGAKQ